MLENHTRIVLPGITVENQNNKQHTQTDDKGAFDISAKVGDLLVLTGFTYLTDTLLIIDMHEREIFMEPKKNMLKEVKITDTSGHSSLNPGLNDLHDPDFHNQTVVYSRNPNGSYKGGITLRLSYWKKDEHKKEKFDQMTKDVETSDQIRTVFNADNLSHYISLKGEDMDNFVLLYMPDVKTYTNPDFNLITYLDTCYKAYLNLTPEERRAAQIFDKK